MRNRIPAARRGGCHLRPMNRTIGCLLAVALLALPGLSQAEAAPGRECTGRDGPACWYQVGNVPDCWLFSSEDSKWRAPVRTGRARGGGECAGGKAQGVWVLRFPDGSVGEGPFVDGKQQGDWVQRLQDGTVLRGPYVDGKQQGDWVQRSPDGTVSRGPVVDGKQQGDWVQRFPDGSVARGPVVDGKQQGRWVWNFYDGTCARRDFSGAEDFEAGTIREFAVVTCSACSCCSAGC